VFSNYTANFKAQSREMIEINWSKSKNHKFSSKFFPTFVHGSSHLSKELCARNIQE